MNYIEQLINKYGQDKTDKLLKYIDLVLEKNEYINLTAVKDRDEAIQKHIMDSLTICDMDQYRNADSVIDIGTGAGFPGALLAIVSPDKNFILLDSTLKRLKVIDEFAEILGIGNITTVHARAEEIARKEVFAESFDLCVSRAVANLQKLSTWCLPFVKKGGYFVSYKGENFKDEIDAAKASIRKFGGIIEDIEHVDSDSDHISGHVLISIKKQ